MANNAFIARRGKEFLIPAIDKYLIEKSTADEDRAPGVISPSQFSKCLRAQYFARLGYEKDQGFIDPQTQRIFDNGTHMHLRIQEYLMDAEVLLMDEVPLFNEYMNIQGHTDGLLRNKEELAVLELKSIRQESFTRLTGPKEDHFIQGSAYVYCLEKERQYLHEVYGNVESYLAAECIEMDMVKKRYAHLVAGRKFTKEQKIEHVCRMVARTGRILLETKNPIDTVFFLYENKNTQELKEYKAVYGEEDFKWVEERCAVIEKSVRTKTMPERGDRTKSCYDCKYCDYQQQCWGK